MDLESIERLKKDIRDGIVTLSPGEARFLVDAYYIIQEDRKRSGNQVRALDEAGEPHAVLAWFFAQNQTLEGQLKRALGAYAEGSVVGRWLLSLCGVGPVIAAGLLAHIDIEQAPTVGHIWRFAGLDPTVTWEPKTKRPWNAGLRTLCWKVGESVVKQSGREQDIYGRFYLERKAYEQQRNDAGALADQAAAKLARYKIGKTTEAYGHYAAGHLPPAHIHARAKRWTVKLFLSHLHYVMYETRYGTPPPKPYILTQPGHAHEVRVPNWPMM